MTSRAVEAVMNAKECEGKVSLEKISPLNFIWENKTIKPQSTNSLTVSLV